jgi:hypothetical protein
MIDLLNRHTDFEVDPVAFLDLPVFDFDFDLCLSPKQKKNNFFYIKSDYLE